MGEPVTFLDGRVALYLGDCREILPTLRCVVDHVICDPPYEAITQSKWGVLAGVEYRDFTDQGIGFQSIDADRDEIAARIAEISGGWGIVFCQAEGVRAWRDAFAATKAKYKRAMVWVKPDAMPQFNGQGPSVGHEMIIAVWCGVGHSKWNGGGRPGTFTHNKNSGGKHVHPTQKPLPLMLELVDLFSDRDERICDPFLGSGTTGVAAVTLGRRFVGIERDPAHFETACRRIEEATKQADLFIETPPEAVQADLELEAAE